MLRSCRPRRGVGGPLRGTGRLRRARSRRSLCSLWSLRAARPGPRLRRWHPPFGRSAPRRPRRGPPTPLRSQVSLRRGRCLSPSEVEAHEEPDAIRPRTKTPVPERIDDTFVGLAHGFDHVHTSHAAVDVDIDLIDPDSTTSANDVQRSAGLLRSNVRRGYCAIRPIRYRGHELRPDLVAGLGLSRARPCGDAAREQETEQARHGGVSA